MIAAAEVSIYDVADFKTQLESETPFRLQIRLRELAADQAKLHELAGTFTPEQSAAAVLLATLQVVEEMFSRNVPAFKHRRGES